MANTDIRAFIFDMDGILTDTVDLHYRAWLRLAQEEGATLTSADNDRLRGLSRRDSLKIVFNGRSLDEVEEQQLMARKQDYFLELLADLSPADRLPGVTALLEEARAQGIRLGLASSSQNVYAVLQRLQLLGAFDALADAFTVNRTKPAPDVFLWVAGRLDVRPAQAVIFEDAGAGVEAALAGGFWVVGAGSPQVVGDAHIVVESLAELTVSSLIEMLQAVPQR